jgi:hypothetical protein
MRKAGFISRIFFLGSVLTLVGAVAAGCGENPVPETVLFNLDVQPLLQARCVRCHGAGGTLNGDSDIVPGAVKSFAPTGKPLQGFFDCAADRGDCSGDAPTAPACKRGFRNYAAMMPGAGATTVWLKVMPPGPSEPLTSRESEILHTWLAHPDNQAPLTPCD